MSEGALVSLTGLVGGFRCSLSSGAAVLPCLGCPVLKSPSAPFAALPAAGNEPWASSCQCLGEPARWVLPGSQGTASPCHAAATCGQGPLLTRAGPRQPHGGAGARPAGAWPGEGVAQRGALLWGSTGCCSQAQLESGTEAGLQRIIL